MLRVRYGGRHISRKLPRGGSDARRQVAVPMLSEPARTFRNAPPDPPDQDRAARAEQHHPAPAIQAKRSARNQQPGEKRDHRHGAKLDGLIDRERAAAQVGRHQFRQIGVDGDQLDADADAGDEAPQVEAEDIVLERHDDARDGVPEQRVSEDGAAAETVGHEADERGSDEESGEHGGDEARDAGGAEEAGRGGRQDAGADQAGGDVAGEEDIVELEEAAQGDEGNARPDAGLHGIFHHSFEVTASGYN